MRRFPRRFSRRRASYEPEVVLTPLIDAVLVLLIVFMITMPALQNVVPVNLPDGTRDGGDDAAGKRVVEVYITEDKSLYVDAAEKSVSRDMCTREVNKALERNKTASVHIKADKGLDYGYVIGIACEINALQAVADVALPTEID